MDCFFSLFIIKSFYVQSEKTIEKMQLNIFAENEKWVIQCQIKQQRKFRS